jgi:hypothetical protein
MAKTELKTEESREELLSISKLAFRFNLDRATVKKRIAEARIEPAEEKANEKLYELTEELNSILNDTAKPLDIARLTKLSTENEIKELELQKRKGELLPIGEVKEAIQGIFAGLQKEIVTNLPKKLAPKLKKAKTVAEITGILVRELDIPFNDLAEDYEKFLK